MAELAESGATLVISGPDLVPDEITDLLGAQPRRAEHRDMEVVLPGGGRRVAERGYWERRAATRQPGDLDAQIAELFAGLPADRAIWSELAARFNITVHATLFLATANEATALSAEALALLGERHVRLKLDVYGPYTPAASCGG